MSTHRIRQLGITLLVVGVLGAPAAAQLPPSSLGGYALRSEVVRLPSAVVDEIVPADAGVSLGVLPNQPPERGSPGRGYVDLDVHPDSRGGDWWYQDEPWDWTLLPTSLIYRSYLAGVKESRFSSQHVYNQHDGWLWDATLGARVGLLRYGDRDPVLPHGWQLDAEGSAQARLDIPSDVDVRSVDFRAGVLLTRGVGPWQSKFGYYHLSSHLGDEFLLHNPDYHRLNYSRDALVLGQAYQITDQVRVYAEATWAFQSNIAEPWEFQFGVDIAPPVPTGIIGAPFFAINGYLRQEVNFGGNLVVQTGWAWRGDEAGRLLRIGVHYYNGKSDQFSFYNRYEQQLGVGVWYDF